MKKRILSTLVCAAMLATAVAVPVAAEEEPVTLTFLMDAETPMEGLQACFDLAEEKLGIHVETEIRVGGGEGETIVKTRLASGEMADFFLYNSGAKVGELSPEENIADISGEEWASVLDDVFAKSVSAGTEAVYGIPGHATQLGAFLYNKAKYEEYGLEVPKTWDEFKANCEALTEAGEIAVIDSYADSWTSQVVYLGDHYNVLAENPDFPAQFQAGEAKYADSAAGVASFQKIADCALYHNEDYTATTYNDAVDMLAYGEGVHWCILSNAVSTIGVNYPDEVNDIGLFGIPGTDADNMGVTVWQPSALYANKNSENLDKVLELFEFLVSEEAIDAHCAAQPPSGPYSIKGYELPEDCYTAIKDAQAYFDEGKTCAALEFETSVKGASCEQICQEVGTGQCTAEEAAANYDEDCKKMATQLGLNWE